MGFLAAIFLLTAGCTCRGSNVDTEFPVYYNGSKGSYFGYTVALFRNSGGPVVAVGAPRANSTTLKNIYEPGALFKCGIPSQGTSGSCAEIALLKAGNQRGGTGDYSYREKMDGMWLGVSLDVQQGDKQKDVVACAHLWKNRIDIGEQYVNGICYLIDSELKENSIRRLMPLIQYTKRFIGIHGSTEYRFVYGQAGMSAAFSEDSSNLVLGAPGILTWGGSVVKYKIYPGKTLNTYDEPYIPLTPNAADFNSYLGYAVSVGKFLRVSSYQYAVGAPRDGSNHGMVYIVTVTDRFYIHEEKKGDEYGEYFGACVLGVDLNSDGLTDLLVGSPLHSVENVHSAENKGDEGRVYLYISNGKDLQQITKVAGDEQPGARFGTAIANIGDVNQDGYTDIAIGAPYEKDRGAVYIYHGANFGLKRRYAQKIGAADIDSKLSGFGIHISRGLDVDENGHPDFLVGSYASSHAVLFRSRRMVLVSAMLQFNPKKISMNTPCKDSFLNLTCVDINACIHYDGKHLPPNLEFKFTLLIKDQRRRGFFEDGTSREVKSRSLSASFQKYECFDFRMFMRSGIKNKITPMQVQFSHALKPRAISSGSFDKTLPVYHPDSQTDITSQIPFHTGCGKEDECRSDITVTVKRLDPPESTKNITLGKDQIVYIEITIKNSGEPAYLTELQIKVPPKLTAINQGTCENRGQQDDVTFTCDVGNPLRKESEVKIHIKLDTKKVPPHTDNMAIYFEAVTISTEIKHEDNWAVLPLYFETLYDIGVTGITSIDQLMNHGLHKSSSVITHTYIVRNYGPSPLQTIEFFLNVPNEIIADDGLKSFLIFTAFDANPKTHFSVPVSCDVSSLDIKPVEAAPKNRTKTTDEAKLNIGAKQISDSKSQNAAPSDLKMNVDVKIEEKSKVIQPEKHSGDETITPEDSATKISCDSENIRCVKLRCNASSFNSPREYAEISVSFYVNFTALDKYLSPWYHIELITDSEIKVNEGEAMKQNIYPDVAQVKTDIRNEGPPPPEKVKKLTYFLSIGLGALLLLIILIILIKVGFFRRKEKDKIKRMLSESQRRKAKKEDEVTIKEEDQCEVVEREEDPVEIQ